MATTYITGIEVRPGRSPLQTAFDSITYITNSAKTRNGELVSSFRCDPGTAHFEMIFEQHEFEQKTGRKVVVDYADGRKSYLLMTMRQSFLPGEVTPEKAHELGCELAKRFLKGKYQYVVATHIDKAHIHNHIIFNIVGPDMKKFRQTKFTPRYLRNLSDRICEENNLSVVVPSADGQKRKYTNEKVTPFRVILKNDIDRCIREARDYEDFIQQMQKQYYVDETKKYLSFRNRTNGQQRSIRSYKLGKGYTWNEIRMRCEIDEEIVNPITISQKLRNIEALIHAAGFVRENGSDFAAQSEKLNQTMEQTQLLMDDAQQRLQKAEIISKCYSVIEQYRPFYEQYRSGLFRDQGAADHRDEIEMYQAAVEALRAKGFSPNNSAQEHFQSELAKLQRQYSDLQTQFRSARKQLQRVEEVQDISDRVDAEDPVISVKKGGRQYDRR